MPFIAEVLQKEKKRQEELRAMLRGSYNRKYEEYVCEDMKRIQSWLGHSTIAITADTYSHLEFASKVDSGDLISDSLLA